MQIFHNTNAPAFHPPLISRPASEDLKKQKKAVRRLRLFYKQMLRGDDADAALPWGEDAKQQLEECKARLKFLDAIGKRDAAFVRVVLLSDTQERNQRKCEKYRRCEVYRAHIAQYKLDDQLNTEQEHQAANAKREQDLATKKMHDVRFSGNTPLPLELVLQ